MPAFIRLAVIALAAVCTSGCLTAITSIKVRPDGSGTIEQTLSMSAAAAAQVASLAKGFGGEAAAKDAAEPEFFTEAEMKAAAPKFGSGVTFVSSTPIKTADRVGRVATYQFTDVTKLSIDQKPQTGELGAAPASESADEDMLFRFTKQPSGTSVLTVVFPEAKLEEARKEAAEKQGSAAPKVDPAQMAMIKKLFDGLRVEIAVDVLGTIVKTNSPYVQGSRVTLLEMNFSELLTNDALLSRVAQPKSIEEAKRLLKDVKGFKVNLDREVTIEFR
jgi:hypothetical protein